MPKAHPPELRARVVDAYENGEGTYHEIAERFAVGEASVNRWVSEHRRSGRLDPKPTGGWRGPRLIDTAGEAFIAERLKLVPDLSHVELAAAYERTFDVKVAPQRISDVVKRIGLTRKRGSSVRLQD